MWEWRPTRLAILRRSVLSFLGACLALAITAGVVPELRIDGLAPLAARRAPAAGARQLARRRPPRAARRAGRSSSPRSSGWSSSSWRSSASDGCCRGSTWTTRRRPSGERCSLTVLNSLFAELVAVSDDDSYYSVLVRRLVAREFRRPKEPIPGLLVVQVDGLEPARAARGDPGRAGAGARPAGARRRGDAPPVDRACCRPRRRPARRASCTAATTGSPAFAGTRRRPPGCWWPTTRTMRPRSSVASATARACWPTTVPASATS